MEILAKEFDYIIAGAGSAGCALAARQAEDPSLQVCLVEAVAVRQPDDLGYFRCL
jgi:choline dehydrogenase-like flavoprotein